MRPSCVIALSLALTITGCADRGMLPVTQADIDARSRLMAAQEAVAIGKYPLAESLMQEYVYRSEKGELKMKFWGLSGKNRKMAIDVVSALLWETGRDETSAQFADDYLSGDERQTVHCRLAERQARYNDAFQCWNDMGQGDRADRVLRTKGAMDILAKP